MYEQYSQLISLFLEINPSPSDAQFHALADACGLDPETLEAVAYRMLAEQEGSDIPVDADNDRFSGESLGADVADLVPDTPAFAEDHEEQQEVEDENAESYDEQAEGDEEEGDDLDACDQVGLLAAVTPGVDDLTLTTEDRTLSDDIGQEYLDDKDAALTDGSTDPKDSTEIQNDTAEDGSTEEFDQSATESDGPVVPSITKRPVDSTMARVLARLSDQVQ